MKLVLFNFKRNTRQSVQDKFYEFLEEVEENIPFFDWFSAYAQKQGIEYPFPKGINMTKQEWKLPDGSTSSSLLPPPKTVQLTQLKDDQNQPLIASPFKFKNISKPIDSMDIKNLCEQNNYTNRYLQTLGSYIVQKAVPSTTATKPSPVFEAPIFKPFEV